MLKARLNILTKPPLLGIRKQKRWIYRTPPPQAPDWQEKELAVQKRLNEMQQKQEKERIARERQQGRNREPSECEIAQRRHLAAREGRLYVSRGDGPKIKANTEADIHYFEQDALRLCK